MNYREQDTDHGNTYINHTEIEKREFALLKRLRQCSPSLHRNYLEASAGACMMLDRYKNVFPQYTDHSSLHCLNIMNLAGQLMGDCLEMLNGSGLYVLLTGLLFHDLGMGISNRDRDCLPYIAGIIRLADEMDLCRDRNSTLGVEEQMISDSYSQLVWRTHGTVTGMELTEEECILYAEGGDRDTWEELEKWAHKLQKTMDEVKQVITFSKAGYEAQSRI